MDFIKPILEFIKSYNKPVYMLGIGIVLYSTADNISNVTYAQFSSNLGLIFIVIGIIGLLSVLLYEFLYKRVLIPFINKKSLHGVVWKYSDAKCSAIPYCPKCDIEAVQLILGRYKENRDCAIGVLCAKCETKYPFINKENNPYPHAYAQKEMNQHFWNIRKIFKFK